MMAAAVSGTRLEMDQVRAAVRQGLNMQDCKADVTNSKACVVVESTQEA
ncbi:MAG TPA: hypothetical protein V6C97_22775 [Oculatellaceae cyanobacterium]